MVRFTSELCVDCLQPEDLQVWPVLQERTVANGPLRLCLAVQLQLSLWSAVANCSERVAKCCSEMDFRKLKKLHKRKSGVS